MQADRRNAVQQSAVPGGMHLRQVPAHVDEVVEAGARGREGRPRHRLVVERLRWLRQPTMAEVRTVDPHHLEPSRQ
jgi:hypothetical protein